MPIVALAFSGTDTGTSTPTAVQDTPKLYLTGGNGDYIDLTDPEATGYSTGAKSSGLFGMAPRAVRMREGAGDGARWGGTRRPARPIDVEVKVQASSWRQMSDRLARLSSALDDRFGPSKLTVVSPSAGEGLARSIEVHYSAGFEGATGGDDAPFFQRIPLTLSALTPYWSTSPLSIVWSAAGSVKPFLSATSAFFPVRLASSQVLGSVTLSNPGTVPSPAKWTVTGPGGPITISPVGEPGFVINTTLTTEVITVQGGTVTDASGANRYDLLSPAPRLWKIPPGDSTATVTVTGATSTTKVRLDYTPFYEVAL